MLNTNQHLSRLALGTAQFGMPYGIANKSGQVAIPEAKAMLEICMANGINLLDTAMAYGISEASLGEVGIGSFKVVTKIPPLPDNRIDTVEWIKEQFAASLTRLGVAAVYGLLVHRPQQLLSTDGQKLYQALQEIKENGLAQKIGISIYNPSELEVINSFFFDLVQAPFNLLDRRLHTTGWLSRLKDMKIEVHTRSVFLQGLLLMPVLPAKFVLWQDLWFTLQKWLKKNELTAIEACLAYPLAFSDIDCIIVGADSASQLIEIIEATKSQKGFNYPNLECNDEQLINPSLWSSL